MTPAGLLAYGGIYVAAMIEGEVVFVTAAVMVAAGELRALPVIVCGALGAATGDQFWFYVLRGRVDLWAARFKPVAARQAAIVARVTRHQTLMVLAMRFAPGLRIAIAAACAYSRVPPLRFTVLNLIAAFAWAISLLTLVARAGPAAVAYFGINSVWGAIVPAALVLVFAWWLGRQQQS